MSGEFIGGADYIPSMDHLPLQGVNTAIETERSNVKDFVTFAAPGAVVGFIDTVGQSLGLLSEDSMRKGLMAMSPAFASFYGGNQEGLQTVGDIAGLLIPGMAAVKAVRAGSMLHKAVNLAGEHKVVNSLFNTSLKYDDLTKQFADRTMYLAKHDGHLDPLADAGLRSLRRQVLVSGAVNSAKEGAAFELGVLATMNASNTLYPEEWDVADHAALAAVGIALPAGVEHLFAKRLLNREFAKVGHLASETRNPSNAPLEQIIFRGDSAEGSGREFGLTWYGVHAATVEKAIKESAGAEWAGFRSNMNMEAIEANNVIKKQLELYASDATVYSVKGITQKFTPDTAQMLTMQGSINKDSTTFLGTQAIDTLTPGRIDEIIEAVGKKKNEADTEFALQTAKAESALESGDDVAWKEAVRDAEKARKVAMGLGGLQHIVLEPDGSMSIASQRKAMAHDSGDMKIRTQGSTAILEDKVYFLDNVIDPAMHHGLGAKGHKIGVTQTFDILLPKIDPTIILLQPKSFTTTSSTTVETVEELAMHGQVSNKTVMRANVFKIVGEKDLAQMDTHILHDMGKVYHFKTGQLGAPIFDKLPPTLQREIENWTGDSGASAIREWVKNNDPKYQQIVKAYEGVGMRLHELKDAHDGTILLFRGQHKAETKSPINDVVSMSSSKLVANRKFGAGANSSARDTIAVRVPIEDVIMIVGGAGDEYEFIVKGHLNRVMGDIEGVEKVGPAGTKTTKTTATTRVQTKEGVGVAQNIESDLEEFSNYSALDYFGRTGAFMLLQQAVEKFPLGKETAKVFLGENSHWTKLEAAQHLMERARREGVTPENHVKLPKAWAGSPDAEAKLQYAIVQGKFQEFNELMDYVEAMSTAKLKHEGWEKKQLSANDIRIMLNLPGLTPDGKMHPLIELFQGLRTSGKQSIMDADFAVTGEMGQTMKKLQAKIEANWLFPEVTQGITGTQIPMRGGMMEFPKLKTGEFGKPVILSKRPLGVEDLHRDQMELATMQQSARAKFELVQGADQAGATFVSHLAKTIDNLGATQVARGVPNLVEGTLPGKGRVFTQAYNARTSPELEALTRVVNYTEKEADNWLSRLMTAPRVGGKSATEVFNTLRARNNAASLDQFNMFVQARRYAWDLEHQPQVDAGRVAFELSDTERNRALMKQYFPDVEFAKGMAMPNMSNVRSGKYQALVVDQMAFEGIESIRQLGLEALKNGNHLRKVYGKTELNQTAWWVPPPNLARENVAFILRGDGVPKKVVYGKTQGDLQAAIKAETDQMAAMGEKVTAVQMKTMEKFHDSIGDHAFANMLDYSDSLIQTGRATGATSSLRLDVSDGILSDAIQTLTNQFSNLTRRTRIAYFEPEYNRARLMHNASGYSTNKGNRERSIWETYINTMAGGQVLTPNTPIGGIYMAGEHIYDNMMAAAYDKVRDLSGGRVGLDLKSASRAISSDPDKEFAALKAGMGDHNPFENVTEYVEQTFRQSMPPTMRKHMGALVNLTSNLTLRMFETGHPIMNGLSLISTTPAVIRALNRMDGETVAAWHARTGSYSSHLTEDIATLHPGKAIAQTYHRWFNDPEFRAAMERAGKRGMFDPEVSEMIKGVTAPQQGYIGSAIRRATDWVSVLSDKSERFSRGIAFGIGYDIGQKGFKLVNEDDLFLFAQKFADDTIGNYRPQNRPQMFQGAVGMPLGLFQTFMWNYMQRMLGYVENKQWKALATGVGMQAAVFGAKSVPGMEQFTQLIAAANNGIDSPIDSLNRKYGPEFTDLVMYGSVSNIPKIFGGDGMSVYTRGDANIQRVPTIINPGDSPVANAAKQAFGAIGATVDMFKAGGQFSNQKMAEIAGTYFINRPMRHAFEIAAGVDVDANGRLLSNETQTGFSIAARVLGFKPLQETKTQEAYSRVRATEISHAATMERLRESVRPLLRAGKFEGAAFGTAVRDYVSAGGHPGQFGGFLRNQYIQALVTRQDQKLIEALRDPSQAHDALRLMWARSPLDE